MTSVLLNRPNTTTDTTGRADTGAKPTVSEKFSQRARPSVAALARKVLLRSGAFVAFLLLWEFGPAVFLDPASQAFMPPFHVVLLSLITMLSNGELLTHLGASLARSASGFVIGSALGVVAGLLVGWSTTVRAFLNPLLEFFRNTAALALLPVFILILGIGETSKIAIVAWASFFPVLLNTVAGVSGVDRTLLRAGQAMGLPQHRLFAKVILPASVPMVFTGLRMAGASSILVLIAAEMVGAKAGLGFLITSAQNSFRIPEMYAGILAIALLGLAINSALLFAQRRVSRWEVTD